MSEAGYIILIPSVAHVYNYIIFDSVNKKFFIFFYPEETKAFSGGVFRTRTFPRNTGFHLMDCFS